MRGGTHTQTHTHTNTKDPYTADRLWKLSPTSGIKIMSLESICIPVHSCAPTWVGPIRLHKCLRVRAYTTASVQKRQQQAAGPRVCRVKCRLNKIQPDGCARPTQRESQSTHDRVLWTQRSRGPPHAVQDRLQSYVYQMITPQTRELCHSAEQLTAVAQDYLNPSEPTRTLSW